MKEKDRLKSNSKKMMFIYGFLGLFMIFALVVTNTTKPTYSATCSTYTTMDTCTAVAGCMWSSTSGCIGTPTRPSGCNDASTCKSIATTACGSIGYNGCSTPSSTSNGFDCYSFTCNEATPTRPSNCLSKSQCQSAGTSACTNGYTGCSTKTSTSNGFDCFTYSCNSSYSSTQTVTFDGNGGSGGTSKQCTITTQGGTCTVTAPSGGSKSGYTFNGWGTAQNCTSGTIAAGASVTVAETSLHYYYACWQINSSNPYVPVKKTLTFNANGGSGGGTKECTINIEGSYCTITTPSAPTRSGYTFKGWGTSSSCSSGTGAGNNIQVYANTATSYYACWQANPTGSCYTNNTTHMFEWKTTDPGSGYTKNNKSQSACTGCATPYTLENNNCVTHTASAAGCYLCTNTYLYFDSGETLGVACSTTANANYIKPTGDGVPTDICVEKTEYQQTKTVTLTFVGTSTKTKSCTIPANAYQCSEDLIAPTDIIDQSKNFNGWGYDTDGDGKCDTGSGSYTGNAAFRITRASSNRTYVACYLDTDDKPNADYDKKKCDYSDEAPVTRDVNHLYCTYTNISYNKDPNNITGDSTGNIRQCCIDHGYTWVDYNFTSSGWGYEYCIHCGGGTVEPTRSPETPSTPVTSCYGCKVSNGTKYVYATSSAAAASASGGTSCIVANSSNCQTTPTPVTSCYKCDKNGSDVYAFATSKSNAATATGGTACETVADSYCTKAPDECYECTKTTGNTTEMFYTTEKFQSSNTSCHAVDKKYCNNNHCYECTKDSTKKYTEATTLSAAKKKTGLDTCKVVGAKYCKTPDNPKTGTTALVIGWMALIICGAYGLWYYGKTKELNKKND